MMKNAQEVFEKHISAVYTLDPENVMKDYHEDAIFITPEKTYLGVYQIREFYEDLLPKMDGFKIETIKQEAHNNIVYLVWQGKNEYLNVEFCTDTYYVVNGKIKCHTFAGIIN